MRHSHRPSSIFVNHLAIVAGALALGACAAPVSTSEPETSESTGTVSSELFTSSATFVMGGAPGYTIQVGNGLCLEAQPNATVLQARCAIGNPMQRWATTAASGGATLRNAGNSRCLDVEGGLACVGRQREHVHVSWWEQSALSRLRERRGLRDDDDAWDGRPWFTDRRRRKRALPRSPRRDGERGRAAAALLVPRGRQSSVRDQGGTGRDRQRDGR